MHGRVALGVALIGWTPLVAAWTSSGRPVAAAAASPARVAAQEDDEGCVACHQELTPGIVEDWRTSLHAQKDVACADCHGADHTSAEDVDRVLTVTARTCEVCHEERYQQFARGKHAFAWKAMKAMPTTHYKPMTLVDGMTGCGACHKIGLKSNDEIERLKREGSGYGYASCDACHTRHTFSIAEAREPEACATCHMGFDHPQWEMWSTSKHGVRHVLKRQRVLPRSAQAPTCQTCHMPGGNHDVHTAWGFLGVRTDGLAAYPGEAPEWWADRVTLLQGLGVLDPEGQPTARLEVVADAHVARLTAEEFDAHRAEMVDVCKQCHAEAFATQQLAAGDDMIREVDRLMARAIRVVAELYQDGVLAKPATYPYAFPDLLTFHDSPTPVENRLFTMHLKHRMRAFQGVFHSNPDYALWYGWNEIVQDLNEIEAMAAELRAARTK